ncbi:UxaA family hydrolase [Cohaesibacter celericrescens]|jgi:hypothetical protein|uniref:UxaA family hydrolase n=1 Tax=Cohaesibacter celericrescens TaxID=2067669 RepID=UPI00356757F2
MTVGCFKIHPNDNVATLLAAAESGVIPIQGGEKSQTIGLCESIDLGHKVALCDIQQGEAILKFGISIGSASVPIRRGAWVHLHNCESNFDTRSGSLDVHTGATTDTVYE